ncbi:3-isopropylmalate dehydratase, partial [Enterobacter hormaechei]|nr:3-isopropylmalate dehydratase [Enterobacter hormaechei]
NALPFDIVYPDEDAQYSRVLTIDVSAMQPKIAKPHSPDNVVSIDQVANVAISQAYIGSCTGGKLADFVAAARIIKGHKVAIPTYAVPATKEVFHNTITTQIE